MGVTYDASGKSMELGEAELERLVTERSRELIPDTRGAYLKERSVMRREDDVDGRANVTKYEERVLRGG